MDMAHSTLPAPPGQDSFRWHRLQVAAYLEDLASRPGVSQRQFAAQAQLPRSTLQYWQARQQAIPLEPAVVAFFESAVGLQFLHQLLLAAHLAFHLDGGCGLRPLGQFLRLTQLHHFVAASYGAQQEYSQHILAALAAYDQQQRHELAAQMAPKQIALCEDETFHPQTCLVAMEPVSGFILVEVYRPHRDAATWSAAIAAGITGLPVEIISTVSDEARGIVAHTRQDLHAHHAPDLFHVQQDIGLALTVTLERQLQQAQQAQAEAEQRIATVRGLPAAADPTSPLAQGAARQLAQAQQDQAAATATVATCQQRQQRYRDARRGLSNAYHPFDLTTGQPVEAAAVAGRLEEHFRSLDTIAAEAHLSTAGLQHLAKARRLLVLLVATIAFYWRHLNGWLRHLDLPSEQEHVLRQHLLPGHYLLLAAAKASPAAERLRLHDLGAAILQRARDGPMQAWPEAQRQRLEELARTGAQWFQRSSSCVEGRNGHLARWHHGQHRLSDQHLAALTTLHNYYHQRADGTTAAERFFGKRPLDLLTWLRQQVPLPARPVRHAASAPQAD